MKAECGEYWMELCKAIAAEQDHDRFMELVEELNRVLEEKEERLRHVQGPPKKASCHGGQTMESPTCSRCKYGGQSKVSLVALCPPERGWYHKKSRLRASSCLKHRDYTH